MFRNMKELTFSWNGVSISLILLFLLHWTESPLIWNETRCKITEWLNFKPISSVKLIIDDHFSQFVIDIARLLHSTHSNITLKRNQIEKKHIHSQFFAKISQNLWINIVYKPFRYCWKIRSPNCYGTNFNKTLYDLKSLLTM